MQEIAKFSELGNEIFENCAAREADELCHRPQLDRLAPVARSQPGGEDAALAATATGGSWSQGGMRQSIGSRPA
jgi:hypothetical protein